ncbi:Pol polyprotein [Plakobranchus ocellatus]|uniref:Pol polyprotein n=1 Tax=Plakobranchus ocellatus TaxID=259542 RepID=A0AAV4BZ96_9GAST|nr:Pol polyprotein [Plakobranchus ocellatus]
MTKDLDKTPLRCQRLLMRMKRFNAEVVHRSGKELTIADTLSRFPLNTIEEPTTVQAVESYTEPFENYISITPDRLNKIKAATVHDTTLQKVITYKLNGWPDKSSVNLSKFRQVAGKLSVRDGLLIMEQRVVIPESERAQVLGKLHKSHQRINKCRKFAQETVRWPGLSTELKNLICNCKICQESRPEQRREPLQPTKLPSRPWKKLGIDLLEFRKKSYLVVMDYYSRWLEIAFISNTSANTVITKLRVIFATHGLPDELSDNGPQFASGEFQRFVNEMEIKHVTSSPHFPQSNGLAESGVKIAKHILQQSDWTSALMIYRATPHSSTNVSSAEALMNRKIRTQVPMLESQLMSNRKLHKKISSTTPIQNPQQSYILIDIRAQRHDYQTYLLVAKCY